MLKFAAAELRLFAMYVSLPLVGRYLPEKYLAHWRLLVEAMLVLSSLSISARDLALLDINLRIFVTSYPVLYGPRFSGLEVHMLKHSAEDGTIAFTHNTN